MNPYLEILKKYLQIGKVDYFQVKNRRFCITWKSSKSQWKNITILLRYVWHKNYNITTKKEKKESFKYITWITEKPNIFYISLENLYCVTGESFV